MLALLFSTLASKSKERFNAWLITDLIVWSEANSVLLCTFVCIIHPPLVQKMNIFLFISFLTQLHERIWILRSPKYDHKV